MNLRKKIIEIFLMGRNFLIQITKKMVRISVLCGFTWPLVWLYSRKIVEILPENHSISRKHLPVLLALSENRFRGDLKSFVENGKFRVFVIPNKWHSILLASYWNPRFNQIFTGYSYFNPSDEKVIKLQQNLRTFLRKFLTDLYKKIPIKAVLSAAIYYKRDLDIGVTSSQIGVPYIVLHRENLITNKGHHKRVLAYSGGVGKFQGDYVIVHNKIIRDLFIESGFVTTDKIAALGAIRMDNFVKKVVSYRHKPKNKKQITLFSFNHCAGLVGIINSFSENDDVGYVKLFKNVHVKFVELAVARPEINFIIKPKWGGNWLNRIESVLHEKNLFPKNIANLTIDDRFNTHDLIFDSDVVCGFGSTVLLEAAICKKPVIVPHFDEVSEGKYSDYIHFIKDPPVFKIAKSPEEFRKMIEDSLLIQDVSEACMKQRYSLFEKYISSLEGNALSKYTNAINGIINEKNILLNRRSQC